MSQFKTIQSRYTSKCRRCGGEIPEGTTVRWLAKRGVWHLAADCGIADQDAAAEHYRETYGDTYPADEVGARRELVRDPGEDAADRWAEADAGGPF